MLSKRSMFMRPLVALALAAVAFMAAPVSHAADPPVLAASTASVEPTPEVKTVTGYATANLAIAVLAVLATVGFIVWRNRIWNKGGSKSGSPGRPNKEPLEPYPRE